jgi:hypothetical protein
MNRTIQKRSEKGESGKRFVWFAGVGFALRGPCNVWDGFKEPRLHTLSTAKKKRQSEKEAQ